MSRSFQPQPGDFPVVVELPTRFGDMDILGHINNVAIANLYQEGRVHFHRQAFQNQRPGDRRRDGVGPVLADLHIAYRRESFYPKPVTIAVGVGRLGNTSYTLKTAMFQDGQCVGTSDAVLVYVKDGKPHPIPEEDRVVLADHLLSGES